MNSTLVIWIYTTLLLAGGLMGFIKAKSKASLVMSAAFALPLILANTGTLPVVVAPVVIGTLFGFFTSRYVKTKKLMPGGFMALVSLVALLALGYLLWLRKSS